jgi:hypothetical protein
LHSFAFARRLWGSRRLWFGGARPDCCGARSTQTGTFTWAARPCRVDALSLNRTGRLAESPGRAELRLPLPGVPARLRLKLTLPSAPSHSPLRKANRTGRGSLKLQPEPSRLRLQLTVALDGVSPSAVPPGGDER